MYHTKWGYCHQILGPPSKALMVNGIYISPQCACMYLYMYVYTCWWWTCDGVTISNMHACNENHNIIIAWPPLLNIAWCKHRRKFGSESLCEPEPQRGLHLSTFKFDQTLSTVSIRLYQHTLSHSVHFLFILYITTVFVYSLV